MGDFDDGLIRMIETLIVSGVIALTGYLVAIVKVNRKSDKSRDIKLDKLVEYHEGIPADDFLGLPAVPGLNDRLRKQEMISAELAATQEEILEMVHTKNGKTIGQKVDNIENIATAAAKSAEVASAKTDRLSELVEDSLALQEAHLNDGKTVMEIGVVNDEAEWEALRQHGIKLPEYVYPPEDVVFSLEDLKNRQKKDSE